MPSTSALSFTCSQAPQRVGPAHRTRGCVGKVMTVNATAMPLAILVLQAAGPPRCPEAMTQAGFWREVQSCLLHCTSAIRGAALPTLAYHHEYVLVSAAWHAKVAGGLSTSRSALLWRRRGWRRQWPAFRPERTAGLGGSAEATGRATANSSR
jgi:hypothetical protein